MADRPSWIKQEWIDNNWVDEHGIWISGPGVINLDPVIQRIQTIVIEEKEKSEMGFGDLMRARFQNTAVNETVETKKPASIVIDTNALQEKLQAKFGTAEESVEEQEKPVEQKNDTVIEQEEQIKEEQVEQKEDKQEVAVPEEKPRRRRSRKTETEPVQEEAATVTIDEYIIADEEASKEDIETLYRQYTDEEFREEAKQMLTAAQNITLPSDGNLAVAMAQAQALQNLKQRVLIGRAKLLALESQFGYNGRITEDIKTKKTGKNLDERDASVLKMYGCYPINGQPKNLIPQRETYKIKKEFYNLIQSYIDSTDRIFQSWFGMIKVREGKE